jgi:hypothetical protein
MDPVTLVIGALAAGAATALEESATSAVSRAYRKLKQLVSDRLVGARDQAALERYESDPHARTGELTEVLTASGAAYEETVLAAAREMMALIDPSGTAAGKYVIDLREAQGVQFGDGNTQTNIFGRTADGVQG